MKRRLILSMLTITISMAALTFQARAQEQKIDQNIQKFAKFMGTWHANVNSTSNGKTQVIDYTVAYNYVASGSGIYMEETAKSPEGTYTCGNLIGYDPYGKKLHWFSVDNMGTAHDHSVTWKSPEHFTLLHNSMRDGKKYSEEIECTLKSNNTVDLLYIEKLDGKVAVKSVGTFEKVSK